MAEQEQRQEYELPDISEEQIEKAAMPVGKRADEEVSEETQYIELEENKDGLKPIEITEDYMALKWHFVKMKSLEYLLK